MQLEGSHRQPLTKDCAPFHMQKAKRIKKLESENVTLQARCKTMGAKAAFMVQEQAALQQKTDQLAKLCRALQQRAAGSGAEASEPEPGAAAEEAPATESVSPVERMRRPRTAPFDCLLTHDVFQHGAAVQEATDAPVED